jgi:hypothetical protein
MSYCQLLGFRSGGFDVIAEFKNAHGWTAFVWNYIFKKYITKKSKYDSWLFEPERLWNLEKSERLDECERFVLRSTFDTALVKYDDIGKYIECLSMFYERYNQNDFICHIPDIIEQLKNTGDKYLAIGYYGMSCGGNPWQEEYDSDSDSYVQYDIETGNSHFFVNGNL